MSATELTRRVDVQAPPETVFQAAMDWERQHEWILGTTVRIVRGDGRSVGSEIVAVTGVRGIGLTDRMRITMWEPPLRCEVRHLGIIVRGAGIFEVRPCGRDGATFEWTERLELPLGTLGVVGWTAASPLFGWGLQRSLDRFVDFCRTYPR
ncbi:MAG: SRPBCC family protein [Pseudonocardiaceae bacterium]